MPSPLSSLALYFLKPSEGRANHIAERWSPVQRFKNSWELRDKTSLLLLSRVTLVPLHMGTAAIGCMRKSWEKLGSPLSSLPEISLHIPVASAGRRIP